MFVVVFNTYADGEKINIVVPASFEFTCTCEAWSCPYCYIVHMHCVLLDEYLLSLGSIPDK